MLLWYGGESAFFSHSRHELMIVRLHKSYSAKEYRGIGLMPGLVWVVYTPETNT